MPFGESPRGRRFEPSPAYLSRGRGPITRRDSCPIDSRLIHLKIKLKTLADEATHIRREEKKALRAGRYGRYRGLYEHRVKDVRACARHNQLAYGFLRGVPYSKMEPRTAQPPDWKEVKRHAKTFCPSRSPYEAWPKEWEINWKKWQEAAEAYLRTSRQRRAA